MVNIVWFKRDLRVFDHEPLAAAAAQGLVVPLYVVEPDYWAQPDRSARQWNFTRAALQDLAARMAALGASLTVRVGDIVEVLGELHREFGMESLWSHEETGSIWTFERDRRVAQFCRAIQRPWHEKAQHGVVRGLRNRDLWSQAFERIMAMPLRPQPERLRTMPGLRTQPVPDAAALSLADDGLTRMQLAGRDAALALLDGFFGGRGRDYARGMSSPLTAPQVCSRLSPHLAIGTISMRETVQRAYRERRDMARIPPEHAAVPLRSVDALIARLHWHCHFIQKLECAPDLERRPQHHFFERQPFAPNLDHYTAWANGRTGFPFLDACMRSLIATGWINFRMRAMLQSFASYQLGLDWRISGAHLARMFVDYEPGIHWPQVQMQSGQTGINTPRIYNPVKQSLDQDPGCEFIRRWVPELAALPTALLHMPWQTDAETLAAASIVLGQTYPTPIVELGAAVKAARDRLTAIRQQAGFQSESQAVYDKLGSRARTLNNDNPAQARARRRVQTEKVARQLTLDF